MPSVTNYLCSQHHLAEKYAHDTIQSISKCWRFTAGAGEERNVGGVHCHRPHPLAPPTQSRPHFPHLPSPPSRPLYPPPSQLHLPRAEGSSPTELQVGLDHPNDQHPTVSHAHTHSHSHTHNHTHYSRETGLPLRAVCQVLREIRSCQIASHAHQQKSDIAVVRASGRNVDEHCSHRKLPRKNNSLYLSLHPSLIPPPSAGHSSVKEAHRGQKTISLVTTPPSSQPLPPSAAREHTTIAQLLCATLAPQFTPQVS